MVSFLFSLFFFSNAEAASLRQGDRGEQVQWIQERLEDLGYEVGEADGVFGEETRQAVIQFQLSRGLDADGCRSWYFIRVTATAG